MNRKSLLLGLSTLFLCGQGYSQLMHCKETTLGRDQIVFAWTGGEEGGVFFEKITPRPAFGSLPSDLEPWFRPISGNMKVTRDYGNGTIDIVHVESDIRKSNGDCFDVSLRRHFQIVAQNENGSYTGTATQVNWLIRGRSGDSSCPFAPFPLPAEYQRSRDYVYDCKMISPDMF